MSPQLNYERRSNAKRGIVFNHKGGVGKTTLTVAIATSLANAGHRVLLVDSDPQCNLTAQLINEDVVDDLLDNSDADAGGTLWSAVKPVVEGTGNVRPIEPIELFHANLFLLPGDIRLSEFEAELTELWNLCLQRKTRGYRGTAALSYLVNRISVDYEIDYVFYDAGPNIGPLNRSILLDCDFFIPAVACDLFSLRALKTLGRTVSNWALDWKVVLDLAPKGTYLPPGRPKMIGYILQRFRIYAGKISSQYSEYAAKIDKSVQSDTMEVLKRTGLDLVTKYSSSKLGEIKDFSGLATASQDEGVALFDASTGSATLRMEARSAFKKIADRIVARMEERA